MSTQAPNPKSAAGPALAGVQFFFTLAWTVYAVQLPGLLATAGIAASWLTLLLMADQLVFAAMDVAFGVMADRMAEGYRRLARLLVVLSSLSAVAFVILPLVAGVAPAALLAVLVIWVVSASVVRAPTLILLSKRAKAAQQADLVVWYACGMALASALAPFVGLWLKDGDPRLSFTISAVTLLVAVIVLLRVAGKEAPVAEDMPPRPAPFAACLPLLLALGLAGLGFQIHAFVNASPLYQLYAGKDQLPWLMPLLWLGFFAMLVGVGPLFKRFGALPVASGGIVLTAAASYAAGAAGNLGTLILLQLICGVGWAMAFAGLMESAATAGVRGSEGLFMGSFFAVTALSALLRIAFASHWLAAWKSSQFVLPAALLLAAGLIAAGQAWFGRGGAARTRERERVSP